MSYDGHPQPVDAWVPAAAESRPPRPKRRLAGRAGAAAAIACALAAGSYGVASAASGHRATGRPASSARVTASSPSTPAKLPRSRQAFGGGFAPLGGFGAWRGGFAQGGGGTVTALGASTITVSSQLGGSLTVTTSDSTSYSEGGKTVARSALAVGERVRFIAEAAPKPAGASTSTAEVVSAVTIVLPEASGKVVSVSGSKVVVSTQDGLNVTVDTSPATTYQESGQTVPASDLQPGSYVFATGSLAADHTQIDATRIEIVLASLAGRVTAVSGNTISIALFGGTTESVTTGTGTVFRDQGGKTTIASVAKGDFVLVSGKPGTGTSFSAATVDIRPSFPAGSALPASPGTFGQRFGGPGGQGPMGGRTGFGRGWFGSPPSGVPAGDTSPPSPSTQL